jgi:hypothetical protein
MSVEELNLTSCKDVTDIGILHIAQGCPNLKVLDIVMCRIVLAPLFDNPTNYRSQHHKNR